MTLTCDDLDDLVQLRRNLHQAPELSGAEFQTATTMADEMRRLGADQVDTGIGGTGVLATFEGRQDGPTLLFRAELDALPIHESGGIPHRSMQSGVAHSCGHDGHMAILCGLARRLSRKRPARGRVLLLFQPAEETGAGAQAVIDDPRFRSFAPDYAFALHNRPGLPMGHVGLATGPVNCASRGMKLRLVGREAHASEPQNGRSPATALARLVSRLPELGRGQLGDPDYALVTLTHLRMGAPAFGIAPGEADLLATLRTATDAGMASLVSDAEKIVGTEAARERLSAELAYADVFHHCENHADAVTWVARALDGLKMPHDRSGCPMSASEDFGRFGVSGCRSAMLFLGSGETCPALHNPDYDFPDDLIAPGVAIFARVTRDMLG